MAFTVLIDGYNLIAELWGMGSGARELERQRADLLALLADHRAGRSPRAPALHVVFDGWREGDPLGSRTREAGIDVTFSPKGVTADEVIRDLVRERGGEFLVVSSDTRVRRWAEAAGADVATAGTYAIRLLSPRAEAGADAPDAETREAEDADTWAGHTVKKGNPRRRSKRQRALDRRLGKL